MKTIPELEAIVDSFLDLGKCPETKIDKYLYIRVNKIKDKTGMRHVAYVTAKLKADDLALGVCRIKGNGNKDLNWTFNLLSACVSKEMLKEYMKLSVTNRSIPVIFNAWSSLSKAIDYCQFDLVKKAIENAEIPDNLEEFRTKLLNIIP